MGARFVKYNPVLRRSERERMMFIGAAGLALALIIAIVFVLNYKSDPAVAKEVVQRPTAPATSALGTVTLLAPAGNVPAGSKLSNIELKEVYWPRNQVPPGAIRDRADVNSLYAKVQLSAGIPLTRDNLTMQQIIGPMHVRPGYRAVTLEGDSTIIVEGHVIPGSKVDVLLTYIKDSAKTTKVIVQNATVLSLGGKTEIQASPQGVIVPASSTVTLEVSPTDTLKIQTAKTMGRLSLVLRSADDSQAPDETEMNEFGVDGQARKKLPTKGTSCAKGNIKVGGLDYTLTCEGKLVQNSNEP